MITPEFTPALLVAIPLLGAFLTPLIGRVHANLRNGFVILVLLINAALVFLLAFDVFTNGIAVYVFGAQDPNISLPIVRILFEVDALSMFMAIIMSLAILVAVIYSWAFMKDNTGLDKYYTLVLLLTAGMLGLVLTGDMFNFFVFLEITSISSCALIAFWTHQGESLEAAFKYIMISALAALFVLFAVALLYGQYDALNIAYLASLLEYTVLDKIALVLLIVALAMKAGIAPMHMWLPDSYGRAPATISLILVSATLASLYGVLRVVFTLYSSALETVTRSLDANILNIWSLQVEIGMSELLGWIIIVLAVFSIIIGVLMALRQTDFKRLIAFGAVAEIGYMFLAIGAALTALKTTYGPIALEGGIFHILNDALDVGLLFLVAGAVYYVTKERSLDRLGGLARNMKYTTVFFIIGFLAISGMPPMNGFASKLIIYESTFLVNPILAIVAILCSILMLAVFVKVFYAAFMGPQLPQYKTVQEVPKSMLLAMGILACLIVFIGVFPHLILENVVRPASEALLNHADYVAAVLGGVI